MKMFNAAGEAVYFNRIMKNGKEQFVVKALSGQHIMGRDRQKHSSRTFTECTRRRRYSGGQGTNARVDGLDWVPEGNASGTFSLRRLFSTGKNFPHTALHSLDG